MMKLWICGQCRENNTPSGPVWDFKGVFASENKAIEACIDERYFIGPATLGEPHPVEPARWSGGYYPKLEPIAWG